MAGVVPNLFIVISAGSFQAAIYGEKGVYINDRAVVTDDSVIWGEYVEIGADATSNTIFAQESGVFLRDRATVDGDIISAGPVEYQNESTVEVAGDIYQVPSVQFTGLWQFKPDVVSFPVFEHDGDVTVQKCNMPPCEPTVILPSTVETRRRYGKVTVNSETTLFLEECGNYYMDELVVEPNANIMISGSECRYTRIFVHDRFSYKGKIIDVNGEHGNAEHLLVGYFGEQMVPIESTFFGTILAPNAVVNVSTPTLLFVGNIYADYVYIHQGTLFRPVQFAPPWLP